MDDSVPTPVTTIPCGHAAARWLSWAVTAGVIAAGYFALHRLPGAGGRVDELRWQLGSPRFVGSAVNDAVRLLWDADARAAGGAGRILAALVVDPDPLVASRALGLLASELNRQGAMSLRTDPALREAFAQWLRHASVAEKVGHAELALTCSMHLVRSTNPLDLGELSLSEDDDAWLLAGLVGDSIVGRAWAATLVFQIPPGGQDVPLAERLERTCLGGRRVEGEPERPIRAIPRDALRAQLRLPLERIEALLDSPLPSVRFATGAILAFSGDARGLPATREWLAAHKLAGTAYVEELLSDLFGPEWRTGP